MSLERPSTDLAAVSFLTEDECLNHKIMELRYSYLILLI